MDELSEAIGHLDRFVKELKEDVDDGRLYSRENLAGAFHTAGSVNYWHMEVMNQLLRIAAETHLLNSPANVGVEL